MCTQVGVLCAKCNEVINNKDDIFGTSCGHLYHFLCLRYCHGQSTNCSHCKAYKPCMFKMFVQFAEVPQLVPWDNQLKTVELFSKLEEKKKDTLHLHKKNILLQETVQKLESKLKKLCDSLENKDRIVATLEDRVKTLEELNEFITTNNDELNTRNHGSETSREGKNIHLSQNKVRELEKRLEKLSQEFRAEVRNNSKLQIENIRLKVFEKQAKNNIKKSLCTGSSSADEVRFIGINDNNKEESGEIKPIEIMEKRYGEDGIENSQKKYVTGLDNTEEAIVDRKLNAVLIKNFNSKKRKTLRAYIVSLAQTMNMSLSYDDIPNINVANNGEKSPSLYVEFKNIYLKQTFLANKSKVNHIEIIDVGSLF